MMSFEKEKTDFLKAVMVLFIVADHLTFFLRTPWLQPAREVGAPIVSLFFFISGFGLVKAHQTKGPSYLESFIRNKGLRLVLPSLLALICYYCILWDPDRHYLDEWRNLLFYGLPPLPFSWFAIAIIVFYLIYYYSFKYLHDKWKIGGLIVGTFIWMVITMFAGYDRCWWICSLAFPAGAIFASKENTIYSFCESERYRYYALLGGLSILFVILYLPRNPILWTLCYILIPTIVTLIVARIPIGRIRGSVISFLTAISFEIYLCQSIPMELFKHRIPIKSEVLYIIAVYATTIALAFIVNKTSTFFSKKLCTSSTT